jgi:DNA repair photolyase
MEYRYAKYTSLLKKITKKDNLFLGDYTLDPYQNCEFGCIYCDSTLEKIIFIKSDAPEILEEELRKIKKKGTIIIGSVNDPYQKVEKKYKITRNILKIIQQHSFPCHILTKSNLVLRDIDILSKIDKCFVTLSLTSLNKSVLNVFEKQIPSPNIRLQTIKKLSNAGIKTGIAFIPILPFIVEEELEDIVKQAKRHKAQYFLYKYLELKGDQKKIFMEILKDHFLDYVEKYDNLYKDSYLPEESYITRINKKLNNFIDKYNLKNTIN